MAEEGPSVTAYEWVMVVSSVAIWLNGVVLVVLAVLHERRQRR